MCKNFKKALAITCIGLMSLSVLGCSGGDKNNAANKDTLKFAVTNFADSLEPTDNYFAWVVVRYGLGECLVKFDKQMNNTPWLAESWQISPDKLTWTFKINDKAKFSNGNKLTAAAVKSSLERVFAKSNRAKTFFEYAEITADGQTLVIKTTKPCPGLPGMLADPLFVIIDTSVKDRDYAKQGPICTGPYVVKSFTKAKSIMEANPNYWDGTVPFKTIEIPSIDDANTRAMALQSGEVDMAVNIAPGDLSLFNKKDKYNITEIASLRTALARLNVATGHPLSDQRVREALISSLDRETYSKVLLKNTFIPGKAPIPPSLDYGFNKLVDKNAYNVERAKKLLAEAGWKDSDGDGILDKDGKPLTLNFVYYSGRAELPIFAEATQADAKKVGFDIKLKNVDYNVLDGMGQRGEFDLIISNIITANTGDPEIYMNWYWKTNINGSNPQNGAGYSNPKYDALSDSLSIEFDAAKRKDLIISMEQILMDDAAAIFFGYPKTNMINSTNIVGAEILPADYYWITKDIKPAK